MKQLTTIVVATAAALLAACGGIADSGSSSSQAPASSGAATSTTPTTSSTASATADPAARAVPETVLEDALVPASMYRKGKITWSDTWGPDDNWGAGEALGLDIVKGDPSCTQMSEGHPVPITTGAVREIEWPDLFVQSYAESLPTEADVQSVIDQNVAQVLNCTSFTIRSHGELYPAKHTLALKTESKGVTVGVVHQIKVPLGNGASMLIVMDDVRRGTEMMFLVLMPTSASGRDKIPDVMASAMKRFSTTIDAYRAEHPVSGSAG
jgi:hypothetical protein